MEEVIKNLVYEKINKNLKILGRDLDELNTDTDLLKSGIIDSMEFIELLVEVGKVTGVNIENFLNDEDNVKITVEWFVKKFQK